MTMTGYIYHCSAGETFDTVAEELYDDEKYAADLMCANPEIACKAVFSGGEIIRLPVVDLPEEGQETLPVEAPWRIE